MADEEVSPGPGYPGVSYDDAAEYFSDKLQGRLCEVCGTNKWSINVYKGEVVPGFVMQSTEDFSTRGVLSLVLLECSNCGNLKAFRDRFIRSYLDLKRSNVLTADDDG